MSWMLKYGIERAKNKRLIQMKLDEQGLNQTLIAELAGVKKQAVNATLNGRLHSPKVLEALRNIGVAEKYLCDPHKAKEIVSAQG